MQSHPVELREKIIHRSSHVRSDAPRYSTFRSTIALNARTKKRSFLSFFHELRSSKWIARDESLRTDPSRFESFELYSIRSEKYSLSRLTTRDYNRFNRIIKGDQRPMMVGSSAIAISSVGALSLFRFLENSMKAHPERRLHRNTIHARINEKLYLRIAPFGNVVCTCLLSNSIEERSTCITTMLQAAATRLNVHPSKLSPPENWRGDCALSDISERFSSKRKIRSKILS